MMRRSLSVPFIGILAVFFMVACFGFFSTEAQAKTKKPAQQAVDATSKACIDCHAKEHVAPKVSEQWAMSKHAKNGVGCMECHAADAKDADAYQHANGGPLVASKPTPKDCAQCHENEVKEYTQSKHAFPFWLYAPQDRSVFEPIIGTKQGCEQCHNLSAMQPDGSVGTCGICHTQHSFDISVARNPATCGECHLGPDHPQTEIYNESKHGNIFHAKGGKWDLSYNSSQQKNIPIEAPVCTTCHMDAAPGVKATHNVSARLSWEAQAPWSYRTTWQQDKLGTWQDKQKQMKTVCYNCHAPKFVDEYMLTYDLVNLQYNELRRQFLYWEKLYEAKGLIKPLKATGTDGKEVPASNSVLDASWYTTASELMYNAWHHEGRRFRMGSAMGGADYVQWHGIWEIQHDLQGMIEWGADHGVEEAKKIVESDSPLKFYTYKLYDLPGGLYTQVTPEQYDVPVLYKVIPNYWQKVQANVEQAYKKGLLTEDEYKLYMNRYNNRDQYLGKNFKNHDVYAEYQKMSKKEMDLNDPTSPIYQAIHVDLPSPAPFSDPSVQTAPAAK